MHLDNPYPSTRPADTCRHARIVAERKGVDAFVTIGPNNDPGDCRGSSRARAVHERRALKSRPAGTASPLLFVAGLTASNAVSYLFYALASRALGVEAYGTFAALVSFILIVQAPASAAQTIVAKLTSDLTRAPDALAGLVSAVDRTAFVASAVAMSLVVLCAVPLSLVLNVHDPMLLVLAGLALGGALAVVFFRGVLQGTAMFGPYTWSTIGENVGKALLTPALARVDGLRGAMTGVALAYAATAAYTFRAGQRHRRGSSRAIAWRDVAGTSIRVAVAIFCVNVLLLADTVLAKRFLDPFDAGLYGAAALSARAIYAAVGFAPTLLLPLIAAAAVSGRRPTALLVRALAPAGALCVIVSIVYATASRWVVTVIAGSAFVQAQSLLGSYALAISALSVANIFVTYHVAVGRYGFLWPLVAVTAGEVGTMSVHHRTANDLLATIVIGHCSALVVCAAPLAIQTIRRRFWAHPVR